MSRGPCLVRLRARRTVTEGTERRTRAAERGARSDPGDGMRGGAKAKPARTSLGAVGRGSSISSGSTTGTDAKGRGAGTEGRGKSSSTNRPMAALARWPSLGTEVDDNHGRPWRRRRAAKRTRAPVPAFAPLLAAAAGSSACGANLQQRRCKRCGEYKH